jgi:hypothetical protein
MEGIKNVLASLDGSQQDPREFIDLSLIDEIEKRRLCAQALGNWSGANERSKAILTQLTSLGIRGCYQILCGSGGPS